MMTARKLGSTAVAALLLLTSGCSLGRRHTANSKLTIQALATVDGPRTSVSLFVLPVPATPSHKSIFDLSDRGQAALIEKFDLATLRGDLGSSTSPTIIDRATFKRRLVFNLVHMPIAKDKHSKRWRPADRVVWSELSMKVTAGAFKVIGYDRLDTGYEVIDLGKFTRSFEWGTGASVSVPLEVVELGLEGNLGGGRTEELQSQRRIVSAAVSVGDDGTTLKVIREGGVGLDLTGSVVVDVIFAAGGKDVDSFFVISPVGSTSTPSPVQSGPCKPTLKVTRRSLVTSEWPSLSVTTSSDSLIRAVVSGASTTLESDDRVEILRSEVSATSQIEVQLDPVVLYQLKGENGDFVYLKRAAEEGVNYHALTRDEAEFLRSWIEQNEAAKFSEATCSDYQLVGSDGKSPPAGNLEVVARLIGYGG